MYLSASGQDDIRDELIYNKKFCHPNRVLNIIVLCICSIVKSGKREATKQVKIITIELLIVTRDFVRCESGSHVRVSEDLPGGRLKENHLS